MSAFIVVATAAADPISKSVETHFDEGHRLTLREGAWLVDYEGTTQSLAEKLQIRSDPAVGPAVVFRVGNYSGRANNNIWEWLKIYQKLRTD